MKNLKLKIEEIVDEKTFQGDIFLSEIIENAKTFIQELSNSNFKEMFDT